MQKKNLSSSKHFSKEDTSQIFTKLIFVVQITATLKFLDSEFAYGLLELSLPASIY